MIFVTVGTQLPFPRLVSAMDQLALTRDEPVIAQTNDRAGWRNLLAATEFSMSEMTRHMRKARVCVAHAGIGTVLAARTAQTPLIVVPRQAALGEHRNDHQMATARALEHQPGVWVAWKLDDIAHLIDADLRTADIDQSPHHDSLVRAVRAFALA